MAEEQKVIINPGNAAFQEAEAAQAAAGGSRPQTGERTPAAAAASPFSGLARTAPRTLGSLTLDEAETFFLHLLGQVATPGKPQLSAEEQAARISAAIQAALSQ